MRRWLGSARRDIVGTSSASKGLRVTHIWRVSLVVLLAATCVLAQDAPPDDQESLFFDPEDGAFDVSAFLSTRQGFLPVAVPITEPAVGYGLGVGLSFFHGKPTAFTDADGQRRVRMPSTTVVFGAATDSRTWGAGVGHLGVWKDGRVRYTGAAGYASLNLDWYGKGDALGGRSISYNNEVLFFLQRVLLQLGDSDFFLGPKYQISATDSTFDFSSFSSQIPSAELESQTAGLGVVLSYDGLDQPFSPTRGVRAELDYTQYSDAFGGDFDYGKLSAFAAGYVPLTEQVVLGIHGGGTFNTDDAPFYDLAPLTMRGIKRGRYVDDLAVVLEAELRYDVTDRWTLLGFGGTGRVADSLDDLLDAEDHWAGGLGVRYLIAREYGLRMGVDVAYGDDDWTVYVQVGTGWVRP